MQALIYSKDRDSFFDEVLEVLHSLKVQTTTKKTKKLENFNFSVVLGGDGTVLAAARAGLANPVVVINTGHLGFLTSSTKEHFKAALLNVVVGLQAKESYFTTTIRQMLDVTVVTNKKKTPFKALNDIVISKNGLAKLSHLAVYADDELVAEYRADGLIVASPTGSTAYSLSASGPIIHPSVKALVVTPICPQGLTQRPLVLPSSTQLKLVPLESDLFLSIDGQVRHPLEENSVVNLFTNSNTIEFVNPNATYFEVLREKLAWGVRPV